MITVDVHEAQTRLSGLVKAVEERGEIVILLRHGMPVAEIHQPLCPSWSSTMVRADASVRVAGRAAEWLRHRSSARAAQILAARRRESSGW